MKNLLIYGAIAGAVWYYFLRDKPKKKMQFRTPEKRTQPSDIEMEHGAERYIWAWKAADATDPMAGKKQVYVCLDTHTQQHVSEDVCKKYHPGVFR